MTILRLVVYLSFYLFFSLNHVTPPYKYHVKFHVPSFRTFHNVETTEFVAFACAVESHTEPHTRLV